MLTTPPSKSTAHVRRTACAADARDAQLPKQRRSISDRVTQAAARRRTCASRGGKPRISVQIGDRWIVRHGQECGGNELAARRSCVHPAHADAPARSETTPRPLSPPSSPSMPSSSRARKESCHTRTTPIAQSPRYPKCYPELGGQKARRAALSEDGTRPPSPAGHLVRQVGRDSPRCRCSSGSPFLHRVDLRSATGHSAVR